MATHTESMFISIDSYKNDTGIGRVYDRNDIQFLLDVIKEKDSTIADAELINQNMAATIKHQNNEIKMLRVDREFLAKKVING